MCVGAGARNGKHEHHVGSVTQQASLRFRMPRWCFGQVGGEVPGWGEEKLEGFASPLRLHVASCCHGSFYGFIPWAFFHKPPRIEFRTRRSSG